MQEQFQQAVLASQQGRIEQAMLLCKQILQAEPNHSPTLHLLGQTAYQQGNLDEAIVLYKQAITYEPDNAVFANNLGLAYTHHSEFEKAMQAFELALAHAPDFAIAHHNLGDCYFKQKRYQEAIACFDKAVSLQPLLVESWHGLGQANSLLQRNDMAIAALQHAVDLAPSQVQYQLDLGAAYALATEDELACRYFLQVLNDATLGYEGHTRLGDICKSRKAFHSAIACYQSALQKKPEHWVSLNHMGMCYYELGDWLKSESLFKAAMVLKPDSSSVLNNLAKVTDGFGRFDEALALYEASMEVDPVCAGARHGRGLVRLKLGDLEGGWEDYAYRASTVDLDCGFDLPHYQGDGLPGKSLIVRKEQGLGDELIFASCFPDLIQGGATCLIECDKRVKSLFERSFPAASFATSEEILTQGASAFTEYKQISAGELPGLFRRATSDFPATESFLKACPEKVAKWQQWLGQLGQKPCVGICWRSGLKQIDKTIKSPPLTAWGPLLSQDSVTWINLQYGECEEELTWIRETYHCDIHNPPFDQFNEIEDLAALMKSLDLIISPANTVVSVSGGLGVNTWCLMPIMHNLLYGKEHLPWWDNAKQFSQEEWNEWQPLMNEVASALQHWSQEHR